MSSRQSEAPPTRSISVGCDEGNFSFPEEYLFTSALCEIALTMFSMTRTELWTTSILLPFLLHDTSLQRVVEVVGMLDDNTMYTAVDSAEGSLYLGDHALVDGAIGT